MIRWKDILKPISLVLHTKHTINEAAILFRNSDSEIGFVIEGEHILGYVDTHLILQQITNAKSLNEKINYNDDILKVPYHSPVEFYFNSSVYIGFHHNEWYGYITQTEALHKVNHLKLTQMNKSIDSAEIGIITMDRDFKVTFINETAENILGLSRTFLIDRNYRQLIQMDEDLSQVLEGRQLLNVKTSFNFKMMIGQLSPIYEKDKVSGIVHNFHLQHQLEETAKELEFVRGLNEDLKAIYSASNEQIIVVDPSGAIQRLAGTFLERFWEQIGKEDLLNKNVYELEDEGIFTPNIFDKCLEKEKKISLIQQAAHGTRIWSTATPVFDGDTIKRIVIISRDISSTEQLKLEKNREDLHTMAESNSRKPLIYKSKVMSDLVTEMKQIAEVDSTVLLFGESGVGKEVFAQHIHQHSTRKDKPMISMNCGAIPENLLESELFGHEKGAFTGAVSAKKGLFELANGGTLFLDEITELPFSMQVKLLRALQELEIVRVGGIKTIKIDVRIIASTNRDIEKMVRKRTFREDLYYRINVIPMHIPPLRKRKEDIVSLSLHFLQQLNHTYNKKKSLTREALLLMESYHWPGNVRELQNVIERLAVTTNEDIVNEENVLKILFNRNEQDDKGEVFVNEVVPLKRAVKELEGQLIALALQKYGTAAEAAKALKISPATISRRINTLLK